MRQRPQEASTISSGNTADRAEDECDDQKKEGPTSRLRHRPAGAKQTVGPCRRKVTEGQPRADGRPPVQCLWLAGHKRGAALLISFRSNSSVCGFREVTNNEREVVLLSS